MTQEHACHKTLENDLKIAQLVKEMKFLLHIAFYEMDGVAVFGEDDGLRDVKDIVSLI
ncbi:predicted protein [Sclerotinia sclerotiorum 1980 UF-70]|uniref:Uncharacterized protein n=1 Tax=Sclerotinia sclerotiorum (strain ATCC 18683 / 1980 / Ss-1) TaxID=665079 RepID=A7EPK6_SCLS1|nr:predicted protein [Sclerotinia sclerotiorum 1980 UF-70]EDO04772.1 predicted protein [Sclerotinia sclerotiorum 1980 UF-70]